MIKFYYNNLVKDSGLTASTENAQFPASNVKDDRRTKVFRSTTNSDTLDLDFGVSEKINSFYIVDHPKDGFGITTLKIQASQSPTFSVLLLDEDVDLDEKFGQGYLEFTEVEARYFRLIMTSTLGYCEVSNFFVGSKLVLKNEKSINFGWTHQEQELINKSFNQIGQLFADKIAVRMEYNFSFSNLDKDQLEEINGLLDYVGTHRAFFVRIGCPSMTNEINRFGSMVFLNEKPTKPNTFFGRYQCSFTVFEGL
jgi:hypothetical protein